MAVWENSEDEFSEALKSVRLWWKPVELAIRSRRVDLLQGALKEAHGESYLRPGIAFSIMFCMFLLHCLPPSSHSICPETSRYSKEHGRVKCRRTNLHPTNEVSGFIS